ncbi:putative palmitoyltransferase ZDHHC16 [Hypsibius exemplaris]|uniref:Palmitoyltransferase n=1 Tax=Hypsibius exemplaris TaxID=2072580 RepID=A0A1W0WMF2_HYPEX|nr:putative palmitoyltransferase ZDHHC16 [Hypsibius exemplaris]
MFPLKWTKGVWRSAAEPYELILAKLKMCYGTFIYNEHMTLEYAMDTILEPLYQLVDKGYVTYLGPIMIFLVIFLTLSVIAILLLVMLPWYLEYKSIWLVVWHFPVAAYLFFSISFHYIQGLRTPPGYPPSDCSILDSVAICKKCKGPKPSRTHHCSVCKRCVLRMDHHCPWLNNCVGHFNHRYFFLFMFYMWFGSAYLCVFVYPEFRELYYLPVEHPDVYAAIGNSSFTATYLPENVVHRLHRRSVMYMYILSGAASISVFCLMAWHATLISAGESSIEAHINKKERQRLAQVDLPYFNPYNFGFRQNWRIAMCVPENRSFWRHVLWFSSNRPEENGLRWKTALRQQYMNRLGLA